MARTKQTARKSFNSANARGNLAARAAEARAAAATTPATTTNDKTARTSAVNSKQKGITKRTTDAHAKNANTICKHAACKVPGVTGTVSYAAEASVQIKKEKKKPAAKVNATMTKSSRTTMLSTASRKENNKTDQQKPKSERKRAAIPDKQNVVDLSNLSSASHSSSNASDENKSDDDEPEFIKVIQPDL